MKTRKPYLSEFHREYEQTRALLQSSSITDNFQNQLNVKKTDIAKYSINQRVFIIILKFLSSKGKLVMPDHILAIVDNIKRMH